MESKASPNSDRGQFEESTDSMDEDTLSNMNPETSPAQHLKKEHEILSNQVKSFPGHDIVGTLQLLNDEHELLKKKYLDESSERKRLYNELIELKGNIRVFCRCRPLSQAEIANGSSSIVEFDSSQDTELHIVSSDSSEKQFKFDHVFLPEDGQEAIFAQTRPIVTSVLDGCNVCVFAYGQTGTGKTYTMEGTPDNRGVNYRTLEELLRVSRERSSSVMKYELFVSMMELYNDKIKDLLGVNSNQPTKWLEIKESAEGTQEVPGLVELRVYDSEDVLGLLKSGSQVRSAGATNANEWSSHSHCLLHVTVRGTNSTNGPNTCSNLWLVDLAGSEHVGKIEVEGERLKVSQFINKSLSALGDVVSALASKTGHIPYRNSKLTHMLQSSLGGDCTTVMIVQISPSNSDLGETLCSLNFASRVRGIENGPARKQVDLAELHKYKKIVEELKHDEETKKLQDDVQSLQLRLSAQEHTCKSLQETLLKMETRTISATASGHVQKIESCTLPQTLDTLNGEQLLIELSERKRLYNELIELEGNIRVFCRFRPLNDTEIANGSISIIESISSHGTDLEVVSPDSSRKHFSFHQVFKPEDGEEAVFAQTKPFVISVLDGYDVCIFSYGLTGAGKTFTLEGMPEKWGVYYRILEELFQFCSEQNVMQYEIFVSMMEVYNEKIKDLLGENSNQPTKRLEIEQEAEGIHEGLEIYEALLVHSIEELQVLLISHGATKANNLSSRSHRLFRVAVNRSDLRNTQTTSSHLWFVDLAGRGPSEVQGGRLGDVISSLLSKKTDDLRFGDSKLTHLLQSSLGGPCKTLMFVQISPSPADFQESLSALNFSRRVQMIETSPAEELAEAERLKKEQFDQLREEYPKFRDVEIRAQDGLISRIGFLVGVISLVMSIYGSAWLMTDLFCPHHIVTPIPMHVAFGFTIIFAGFLFWRFAEGYRHELGTRMSIPVKVERITRGMLASVGGGEEDEDVKRINVSAKQSIEYYGSLRIIQVLIIFCYIAILATTLITLNGVTQPNCRTTVPIPLEPTSTSTVPIPESTSVDMQASTSTTTVPIPESTSTDMQTSTEQLTRQSIGRQSGITRRIRLQLSIIPVIPDLQPLFYGNDSMYWI